MRSLRALALIATLATLSSGCATTKIVKQAGEQFSEGNIITGLWLSTMGVFIGGIVDVVTLGGLLDESAVNAGAAAISSSGATTGQAAAAAYLSAASQSMQATADATTTTSTTLDSADSSATPIASERITEHAINGSPSTSLQLSAPSGIMASSGPGNCPNSLSHLSSRLPIYNNQDLIKVRNAGLTENINAAYTQAINQGKSPSQIASEALTLAKRAKSTQENAKSCVRHFAAGDPERVISELEKGTYSFANQGGVTEACASQYVVMYYAAEVYKEIALIFACRAQSQ